MNLVYTHLQVWHGGFEIFYEQYGGNSKLHFAQLPPELMEHVFCFKNTINEQIKELFFGGELSYLITTLIKYYKKTIPGLDLRFLDLQLLDTLPNPFQYEVSMHIKKEIIAEKYRNKRKQEQNKKWSSFAHERDIKE